MAKEWAKRFYSSKAWKDCKRFYIQSVNGLCERCLEQDRITPGYILHHEIWLTPDNINDPGVTLNWNNLKYVCQHCHNYIHMSGAGPIDERYCFDESGNFILNDNSTLPPFK